METVNKEEARKQRMADYRERIIECGCGGKFQRRGQTEHFKTKMHINFLQQQEEQERLQEVEDIKEQEIRDNNAEVETWKAEDLLREKEKAEKTKPDKTTSRVYSSGNFGRFRSDYDEPAQPFWGLNQPGFRD